MALKIKIVKLCTNVFGFLLAANLLVSGVLMTYVSYLNSEIYISVPLKTLALESNTSFHKSIDIDIASYFKLEFHYPKAELEKIRDWEEVFGGNSVKRDDIAKSSIKTEAFLKGQNSISQDIKLKVMGPFTCGDNICRRSAHFFLAKGKHMYEFTIKNHINEDFPIQYKVLLSRARFTDEKVGSTIKYRNFAYNIMWLSMLFIPIFFIFFILWLLTTSFNYLLSVLRN